MQFSLFHLKNSRSQRIIWLLEELGVDYQLKIYHEHVAENEQAEIKQFNPQAKFPTLVLNDTEQNPIVLTESGAIAEYCSHLTQKLGAEQLTPKELKDYYFWKNFAEASFMPNLALKQMFKKLVQRTPFPLRIFTQMIKAGFDKGFLNQTLHQQLDMINAQLEHQPYIAGSQFTIADILLWFPLKACVELHEDFQQFPEIKQYLTQIESRPAFQTAQLKGQWSAQNFQNYWSSAYSTNKR